jgi:heme O synthase-like polyprenyltransferase
LLRCVHCLLQSSIKHVQNYRKLLSCMLNSYRYCIYLCGSVDKTYCQICEAIIIIVTVAPNQLICFLMALHMMKKRILVKIFLVVGVTLIISGLIFVAQSNSVIGPKSSFMYSNPKWTVNGFAFSIVGLVVLICGLIIHFAR